MRLGDGPSDNFEDRTGSPGGFGFGGGGGNLLGCLLPLVASRFGLVGVAVLLLGYCALTQLGGGGGGGLLPGGQQTNAPSGQSTLSPENRRLLTGVLESTDSVWTQIFQASGARYVEPRLVAYTRGTSTACGAGQAAMGPFYCPNDQRIYIDPTFFSELSGRFGATGDFAQYYVIAHEVGHHVQNLLGVHERFGRNRSNEASVAIELQADCFAGVWGHSTQQRSILEAGDLEDALNAASAIGDDRIQQRMGGGVQPESFTHGSAQQRVEWFRRGFESGDPAQCDTFAGS